MVEFTVVILTVHFKGASVFINKTEKYAAKNCFRCVFTLVVSRKQTFGKMLSLITIFLVVRRR